MIDKKPWFKRLFRVSLKELFVRFPLSIISIFVATGTVSYITYLEPDRLPATETALILTSVLGVMWFTALAFFGERLSHPKLSSTKLQLLGVIPLALFYWVEQSRLVTPGQDDYVWILFFLMLLASFTMLMVSAYVHKKDELSFWQFSKWLFLRMFLAIFSAVVLFGALALALFSIEQLFNVDIDEKFYGILWEWIAMAFAPLFVLLGAKQMHEYDSDDEFPEIVRKFAQYILSPILVIYFLILYAYMVKILFVVRQWPEGGVALPIIIYTTVVILTMLLTYPWYVRGQKNAAIKILSYLFFSVIPVLPMYFIALGIRIGEYGITEFRYAGVAVGIWFTFVILTSLITKFHKIRVLFGSLACVIIFSSIGPWSMFNASYISQSNHLIRIIEEKGLLNNEGKFDSEKYVETSRLEKYDRSNDIANIARYLRDRHSFARVQHLFVIDYTVSPINVDEQIAKILDVYIDYPTEKIESFWFHGDIGNDAIDIAEFDTLLTLNNGPQQLTIYQDETYEIGLRSEGVLYATIGEQTWEKDISDVIDQYKEKYKRELQKNSTPIEIELGDNTTRVKIIAQSMFGSLVGGEVSDLNMQGYALIGTK